MLGFFHIAHFLVFYFILITVMREWKDWKYMFAFSLLLSAVVSYKSLTGKTYSTIGNTAYVAGYLIFNIYFVLILFFKEKNSKLRWVYVLFLPLLVKTFLNTGSSGGTVGLASSIFVLFFLYGLFSENKKIKKITLGLAIILVIGVVGLFSNRELIKNFSVLSDIRLDKNTFQTRLISWRAAMNDLPNHTLFGTGFGNFAITFDKYFESTFYDHTRSETYFDRAHNNIIEIASTTGLIGLITYLSVFLALGFSLIRGFKKGVINISDFALVSAALVGYFVQNLAVFDSLVTYTALMMVLAYSYYLNNKLEIRNDLDKVMHNIEINKMQNKKYLEQKDELKVLGIVGAIIFVIIYKGNIEPIKMLKSTIHGQVAFAQGNVEVGYSHYVKALSFNTGLDRDSRNTFVREVANRLKFFESLEKEKAEEIITFAINAIEKNVEMNPRDSLVLMQQSQLYRSVAMYYGKLDPQKALEFFKKADLAINKSIESSPGRIRVYFFKAQVLLSAGKINEAIDVLKYAASLNENYYDSFCHLGNLEIIDKRLEEGYKNIDKCLELEGQKVLRDPKFVLDLIKHYQSKEDIDKVIILFERLSEIDAKNAQVLVELARYYAISGEIDKAKKTALQAGLVDPTLKKAAQEFVGSLGNVISD